MPRPSQKERTRREIWARYWQIVTKQITGAREQVAGNIQMR